MPLMSTNDLKDIVNPLYDIMKDAHNNGLLTSAPHAQETIEGSVRGQFEEILSVMPFLENIVIQAAIATFNEVARDPHLAKDQAVDNVCRLLLREDNNYVVTASKDTEHSSGNKRMKTFKS